MIKLTPSFKISTLILSCAIFSACSSGGSIAPESRINYKDTQASGNPLIIPPNLINQTAQNKVNQSTTLSLSQYQNKKGEISSSAEAVLPEYSNVHIESSGNQRWLVAQTSPEKVWSSTLKVLQDNGLRVDKSDAAAGIIETAWAENRADVPESFVRSFLGKYLDDVYSAPTRDKFKIRLERKGKDTLVFITHYGMKDKTSGNDDQNHTWVERPRDPELEAELLSRLRVKLGGGESNPKDKSMDKVSNDQPIRIIAKSAEQLEINRSASVLWVQVGNILDDGAEFHIAEQNQNQSQYTVIWNDPNKAPSTWRKLAFWSDKTISVEKILVKLVAVDANKTLLQFSGAEGSLSPEAISNITNRIKLNLY